MVAAAAQQAAIATVDTAKALLEAWATDRLNISDFRNVAAQEFSNRFQDNLIGLVPLGLGGVLRNPWNPASYTQWFHHIESTVVNQAFGVIMGPLGGALMTVAAPALLTTQVYYEGIGIVDAAQYYQATGDNRLLMVRSSFFLTDFTLTFLTWRLRPPTCNCLAHCFPAGTLVATENGQRAIETVREGERVWAMDLKDGQWKLRHVLQTFERVNDQDLLAIKIGDETIQVTPGHPFWVVRGEDLESRPWPEHAGERLANAALTGRWVDAGDLRVGDVLYLKNGELREIEEILVLEGGQQVYNFHVEELASYAVGEGLGAGT